jgi:MFS superfamily sulfate permease-like transporter
MMGSLPPVVGLYTASVAPVVYAMLGTSNVCAIGPNALVGWPHMES